MSERGDFVWGKIKSFPWWPAMILTGEDCARRQNKKNKLWVFWFGDHKFSEVDRNNIADFKEYFVRNTTKCTGKYFKKAVEEILQVLASINGIEIKDSSELLKWANSGFHSSSPVIFKWKKIELPEIVTMAVAKCKEEKHSAKECHQSDHELPEMISTVVSKNKERKDIVEECHKSDHEVPEIGNTAVSKCKERKDSVEECHKSDHVSVQEAEKPQRGDFVWGKIKSFPWWPAMVLTAEDCARRQSDKNKIWIFWFGDHKLSEVDEDNIADFKEHFSRYIAKNRGKVFKKSVEEILQVLASINGIETQDSSELLKWANSGFHSNSPAIFKWKKKELPKVVTTAVSKNKKRKQFVEENVESDQKLPEIVYIAVSKHKERKDSVEECHKSDHVSVQEAEKPQRGDFVWGKMKSFPWWPAMVLTAEDCARRQSDKNKIWIFWFGDHKFSEVDRDNIADFKEYFFRNTAKYAEKGFKKSVEEVLQLLASINGLETQDSTELLKWANSGFHSSSPVIFKWKKKELPEIVTKAVSKCQKRKHFVEESDECDYDDDISNVHKGLKTLEDICIGCCKENSKLIAKHPLFTGGLCVVCRKNVMKVCSIPCGQIRYKMKVCKDYCIICSQGGSMIYCSNKVCLRAYCQICIEYLASKEACEKILKDDEWLCYLCKTDPNKNCLIRRRITHVDVPSLPKEPEIKEPISVLAHNETARKVLQQAKIKVKNYSINPANKLPVSEIMAYSANYKDFSYTEMEEISADLVTGSFFTPAGCCDRKECVTSFFVLFFRFIFRLDVSRLHTKYIFFIFLADIHLLDENVFARVKRFLMVEPVSIILGNKNMLIWSNFSNCVSLSSETFRKVVFTDNNAAEEIIMLPYMMYLRKYFEAE